MNEEKEFDDWNELKKKINSRKGKIFFKERQIFWANFGKNIGSEQGGKNKDFTRPVLVFKIFSKETFWGLPISTKVKSNRYCYIFKKDDKSYSINISQLRLFSSKRIFRKMGKLSKEDFEKIRVKLVEVIKNLP